MHSIPSNVGLHQLQPASQESARSSFAYFANTVLGSGLSQELCEIAQDVVFDEEDYVFHTVCPRSFALALQQWIASQGYAVVSPLHAPQCETLRWLELESAEQSKNLTAVLSLEKSTVQLQWVSSASMRAA